MPADHFVGDEERAAPEFAEGCPEVDAEEVGVHPLVEGLDAEALGGHEVSHPSLVCFGKPSQRACRDDTLKDGRGSGFYLPETVLKRDRFPFDLELVKVRARRRELGRRLRYFVRVHVEAKHSTVNVGKFLIRNLGTQCWFSLVMRLNQAERGR